MRCPRWQRRARRLYRQLDLLQELRRDARHDLIVECRKHSETKWLRTVGWLGPSIGPLQDDGKGFVQKLLPVFHNIGAVSSLCDSWIPNGLVSSARR